MRDLTFTKEAGSVMVRSAVALLLLTAAILGAGCIQSETVDVSTPSKASLELVSMNPAPGSRISRDTVLTATLKYQVEQFQAQRFIVMVTAATTGSTRTMGKGSDIDQPLLTSASGTVTVTYPLRHLWDDPTAARPFQVWFSINQLFGTMGASAAAARIGPFQYVP